MKYIYFGTPDVAKETLELLVAAGYKPATVVTNPDAPRGRGQVLTPSPVKSLSESLSIPVITPDKLDDEFVKEIEAMGADLAIVVAYGKILPEALINIFPKGVLNVHYSLLPRWRGASPVESALLNGDEITGVSIQKMVRQLDAGDVIATKSEPILAEDTTATLRPRLISLGAELLIDTLPKYMNGEVTGTPQDESLVTHAPKFAKTEGELDLSGDPTTNWRKYRAFAVSPGTYFFENGKRMKIKEARFENGRFIVTRVVPEGGTERDY